MNDITRYDLWLYRAKRRIKLFFYILGYSVTRNKRAWSLQYQLCHARKDPLFRITRQDSSRKPLDIRPHSNAQQNFLAEILAPLLSGQTILASLPPSACRQLWWFNLESTSPFTISVRLILQGNTEEATHVLHSYYESQQPSNAANRLGIDATSNPLHQYSPLAALMPWSDSSPAAMERNQNLALREKNLRDGKRHWPYSTFFGPVPYAFAKFQIIKLQMLAESFGKKGYLRHDGPDGDINGILIWDDESEENTWCVRLDCGGNHRAAVLVAQGARSVPIRIFPENVVRLSEANHWPLVLSKVFTPEEARNICRRILTASPPIAWHPPFHPVPEYR